MKEQDIDNLSKASFPTQDLEFEEKYWSGLEAKLNESGGKKGVIFWWGLGAGIVALVGLSSWFLISDEPKELNKQALKKETAQQVEKENTILLSETPDKNSNVKAMKQELVSKGKEKSIKDGSLNYEFSSLDSPSQKQTKNLQTSNENKTKTSNEDVESQLNSQGVKSQNVIVEKSESTMRTVVQEEPLSQSHIEAEKLGDNTVSNSVAAVAATKSQQNTAPDNFDEIQKTEANTTETFVASTSDTLMRDELEDAQIKTEFGENIPSQKISKFYVEAMGAYLQEPRQNTPSVLSNASPKNSSLDKTFSRQAMGGINVGLKVNNFFFQTGLHFQQINESYSMEISTSKTRKETIVTDKTVLDRIDSSFIRHEIVKVPQGTDFGFQIANSIYDVDTIWKTVYDTTYTESVSTEHKSESLIQKVSYIRIPLIIGYEYQIKKFLVEISTGFETGFIVKSQLNMYDSKSETVLPLVQNDLLNSVTVAFNFNLGVGYYFDENWSVRVRPTTVQSIVAPYKNQDTYGNYGLRIGLRYKF